MKSNSKRSSAKITRFRGSQVLTKRSLKAAMSNLAELKSNTTLFTAQTVTTGGFTFNISNNIIEGSDTNQRDGTQVRLKKIRLEFRAKAVTASQTVRFILYRDLINTGFLPATTDILQSASWLSSYDQDAQIQQKSFSILKDWTVDVNLNGETVKSYVATIRNSGVIFYNGATALSTANGRGAVFLLVIGSDATANYDFSVQLDYTDY